MTLLSQPITACGILIVDDTPDNLRLLTRILEEQGYTVRKALNGRIALKAADRDPPDLILLDVRMPEMDGYEVCHQLRSSPKTKDIPIIFISANDQVSEKVRAFEVGGQDYITKPFQELEVLVRVKNQLLIQQQKQQLIAQNLRLEQEIQERLQSEAEVQRLSITDDLTGLYNRRGFFLLAEQQLKVTRRTQATSIVIYIDLDGLKKVNDALGHAVGDQMLLATAKILRESFRDSDIIARLGGDEFGVFLPVCVDVGDTFCDRLTANIDIFNQENNNLYYISMSFGVEHCPPDAAVSLEELLIRADQKMYEHKRAKYARTS